MPALQWMIRIYDRLMASRNTRRYYEDSGFFNFGYWAGQPGSQREASEALVDRLLEGIERRDGRILDVDCGLGATPDGITAINISEAQLDAARARSAGCAFCCMDAARLAFADQQFDAVICVEAAFHFDTREAFLREAFRVLRPGGALTLSDMLFHRLAAPLLLYSHIPRANFVPDMATYRQQLEAAGFVDVVLCDATQACLGGFRRHLVRWPATQRQGARMSFRTSVAATLVSRIIAAYFGGIAKCYLLASARKPAKGPATP